jgi:MYXO-CTERM domain-containing protein
VGSVSAFSFDIDLAAPATGATGAEPRVSRLGVSPTFMMGNVDLNSENDVATFTTSLDPLACGDGVTGDLERCDDGNAVSGDGCSASCELEAGYSCPVTGTCVDIDECMLGTANCDPNALCTNTTGSFTCACNESEFTGDGATCTDIDECARGTQRCAAGQVCFNVVGGYACHDPCPIGYTEVPPGRCGDIDECALGTSNCDANATCHNTDGWFTCACNPGFCGNGESCSADDTGAACAAICGDGSISGVETCDDGNTSAGDGCAPDCSIEAGATCFARDPKTGKCVLRAGKFACSAQPASPGNLTPLFALSLLGLLLARRRRQAL